MQKFFEKSIQSDFIKSLLYYVPIPQYECVQKGDYVIQNERYVYDGCVVLCTKSGAIGEDDSAQYSILRNYQFGQYDYKITPIFHNTTSYYDSRTHYALGKFLRAYRGMTGIDLMPYYNCYGYETVDNVKLTEYGIEEMENTDKVVYSIPICFNRKYLIHIDKLSQIVIKAVFADEESGLIKNAGQIWSIVESTKSSSPRFFGGRTFKDPIEYVVNIQDQSDQNLYYGQRTNLRLFIQVDKGIESTLSVIETDHRFIPMLSSADKKPVLITVNAEEFVTASDKEQNASAFSQSMLTLMNTKEQYAYTDTLIQYLLLNVIDKEDGIFGNVERVQKAINYGEDSDVWTANLRAVLFNSQMKKGLGRLDIDGNVTKNLESMLRSQYSYKDYTQGE